MERTLKSYDQIYPIQIDMEGAGFCALILVTINQLRYCERNNLYPIVAYDASCKNAFFDATKGDQLWIQYFEPVASFSYEDWKSRLESADMQDHLHKLSSKAAIKISEEDPDSIYTYPFGKWRFEQFEDLEAWYNVQRVKGRETIGKYIKPKPHIIEKVDSFYREYFAGSFVLGLHVRGTDLHYAPAVAPAEYFAHIDERLKKHEDLKIFLATDQLQYIDVFKEKYGNRVFYTDCFRSDNEVAPFNRKESSPYQKGEEVLLDMLLLSRADYLIKGSSNVGEMAMYFNKDLECLDLALHKTKAFGQNYGKGWDNLTNSPAWKLVSKRGLEKVAKDASSQDLTQAGFYRLRKFGKRLRIKLGAIKRNLMT